MDPTERTTNHARSARTRAALTDATVASLIEVGYAGTTGVDVAQRAGVTRGALQYHFPEYEQLLAAALGTAYDRLLDPPPPPAGLGPFEGWVHQAHASVSSPEFKAVLELWLAVQNDEALGGRLGEAMAQGASLFDPKSTLAEIDIELTAKAEAIYRTIFEALVGLGVGRLTNGGAPLGHERSVFGVLCDLARDLDQRTPSSSTRRTPS